MGLLLFTMPLSCAGSVVVDGRGFGRAASSESNTSTKPVLGHTELMGSHGGIPPILERPESAQSKFSTESEDSVSSKYKNKTSAVMALFERHVCLVMRR